MGFLEEVIGRFGLKQLDICQEELAELIQAISKYKRAINEDKNKVFRARESIIEEMTDVMIMLEQMKIIFEINEDEIASCRQYKLNRLKKRIEENKSNEKIEIKVKGVTV